MKKEKCIIFDFSKGIRVDTTYNLYRNGQLDLDLSIEVKSPEPTPEYGSNVIEFKKRDKKEKNSTCTKEQVPIYTA
jgi:hypothetical protein